MNTILKTNIDKLISHKSLCQEEFVALLNNNSKELRSELARHAQVAKQKHYGNQVYIRGLIEFTNYCKNDCYYCGIRCSNHQLTRYRLTKEEILSCCKKGYSLGFRTFVLQGGEDAYYNDERMVDIVSAIRNHYPDCAITLSLGERSYESYQKLYNAGANRYLLRHETANREHYEILHPSTMSLTNRMECLRNLKSIGYQVGCGFMVGSPFQTTETLAEDLLFIQDFKPEMVGIGPYISHKDTPFKNKTNGTLEDTLLLISILRLIHPNLLLPATTALGTIAEDGREQGILAGANVIMPNLSPVNIRDQYSLYDNKLCTGDEDAEHIQQLRGRMINIGHEITISRGDFATSK